MKSNIEDVFIQPLKKVVNERGHLMEVQKYDDPIFPGFGQTYITSTLPGAIKAWYRHHKQVDQIAIIKGELLLVLYDTRENSSSFKQLQEIKMNEKDPVLVQIPTGIWHGFKAVGVESAYLVHLNSKAFSFADADEDRLPYNDPFIPYTWPI
jgi:dTDP-4-dehydrorhamnose 3,5-epimerase